MSEVAALIADMVRAGVDPELIGRTAAALARPHVDEQAERRRAADRERKARLRNSAESADTPAPDKETPPTPPKEINPTPASPPSGAAARPDIDGAVKAYSDMAGRAGLAVPRSITAARRAQLGARLRESGMEGWLEALGKVEGSAFCRGQNDRGWKADLDFLLQPKSFTKILEGHYDDRPNARAGPAPPKAPQMADVFAFIGKQAAHGREEREDSGGIRPALPHVPAVGSGR